MIIGERQKDKRILYKCDVCGNEKLGLYQDIIKKDIHLCRICSNIKSRTKYVEDNNFIPTGDMLDLIVCRGDGLPTDSYLPRLQKLKLTVKCKKCDNNIKTNAQRFRFRYPDILCVGCIAREVWVKDHDRLTELKSKEENVRAVLEGRKNSLKVKLGYIETGKKMKIYHKSQRGGCGLEDLVSEYKIYRMRVQARTTTTYNQNKNIINPDNFSRTEYNLDHKYSVLEGFRNNIPPYIVSSIHNLEVIPFMDNQKKKARCSITKDELFSSFFNEGVNRVAELNYGT